MSYCNLPMFKMNENENALGNQYKLFSLNIFGMNAQRSSGYVERNTYHEYYIDCSAKNLPVFIKHHWKEFVTINPSFNELYSGKCSKSQLTLAGIIETYLTGFQIAKAYPEFFTGNKIKFISKPNQKSNLVANIIHHIITEEQMLFGSVAYTKISENLFCPEKILCDCNRLRYYFTEYDRLQIKYELKSSLCSSTLKDFNNFFALNSGNEIGDKYRPSFLFISILFDVVSTILCVSDINEMLTSEKFCWPANGSVLQQFSWRYLSKEFDINDPYIDEPTDGIYLLGDRYNNYLQLNPMPPNNKIKNCLPLNMIKNLWDCFDSINTHYDKNEYFKKYAKLAAYPILNDTLENIIDSAKYYYTTLDKSKVSNKFMIGDENSIRVIINALDFKENRTKNFTKSNTYRNYHIIYLILNGAIPGFGSRLTMETFLPLTLKQSYTLDNIGKAMRFRFLYNGIDLTSELEFCDENCSIIDFYNYLHNHQGFWQIFESNDFDKECRTT